MLTHNNKRPRVTAETNTVGPTYDQNVIGLDVLLLDCSGGDVIIGGLAGGIDGQILHIAKMCASADDATLIHDSGSATQKIYLHKGADETLAGEYGGWTLVCVAGTHWIDTSHAKHV